MNDLRIGVVGLGFGQYHVKTLGNLPGATLVAVADQFHTSLEAYGKKYHVNTYRDGVEMLERENLDAVSFCVSPRWRLPLIQKAAELGIPMYVEKPWASNLTQAHELAQLCEKSSAFVMTGFAFRYLPAIVKLRELIDSELGLPWVLNGEYVFDWLPPNEHWLWDPGNGNGYFNENSCHLFDAVCYLMGDPVSVMAEGATFRGSPSAEMGVITMRFSSGAIAALTVGGLGTAAFRDFPRINLFTANGQAHLIGREHIWESVIWANHGSLNANVFSNAPEILENTRYSYALKHFVDCIQRGIAPTSGIAAGVRAVAIAEAIYESANSGRKIQLTEYGLNGAVL